MFPATVQFANTHKRNPIQENACSIAMVKHTGREREMEILPPMPLISLKGEIRDDPKDQC